VRNLWFEHVVDAFVKACAEGRDWREACTEAERALGAGPRRVLTRKGLEAKGLPYSRQHIARLVAHGSFPPPFRIPV
jgi:hypothetical protein